VLSVERGGPGDFDEGKGKKRGRLRRRRRNKPERERGRLRHLWGRINWGGAFDLLALVAVVVLVALGVLNFYAMGEPDLAEHHLETAVAGLVLLGVFWNQRGRHLTGLSWACYGTAVLFLLVVMVTGVEAKGATRWLAIGSFTFQPSELAKLGLLLMLATVLGSALSPWRRFSLVMVLAPIPIVLTVLQPDLSTATLLLTLATAMLIMGRIPARFLLPVFGAAVVIAPLAIRLLRPYQLDRLNGFLAGTRSGSDSSWAVLQAHIAIARGGLFGAARDPLHTLYAEYLPERHTDLALASLIEHWGLVAGIVAVLAAMILVWRSVLACRAARTRQAALVAAGLAVLLGAEVMISVGGNLGLLPLAGVPFPLLSYGGTAAIAHLAAFGVVLGIQRDGVRRKLWSPPRWRNPRPRLIRAAAIGVTAVLCLFASFGWLLLSTQGESLKLTGQDQITRCIAIPAPRGLITDRHGTPLSGNATADQVVAVPELLRRNTADITRLATLTGQPAAAVSAAVTRAQATTISVPVADVPTATGQRISAARIPGVVVVPQQRRLYPTGPHLAPVLGFVGVATAAEVQRWPGLPSGQVTGRAGIEAQYDPVLRGVDGKQCVYVDPTGVPVAMGPWQDPIPGANLSLSIDLGLQQQLSTSLDNAWKAASGGRGQTGAVAMDPRNGQILAMAGQPSYDNNIYGPPVDAAALQRAATTPGSPLIDHVTRTAVPPGSTFKLVVATAGLLHKWIPPDEVIPTGGSFTLGNHTFNNWKVLGPMNMIQAIAWSNDVYFYKMAWALGPDAIINTARAYGVGSPTGIDLPGEAGGYLGTPESVPADGGTWYPGSTVILGIGQGALTTTPLQDARWTAGAATGSLVTPRLGLATGTGPGTQVLLPVPAPAPLPFAASLGPVRDGMRAAVTGGTATSLSGVGVPVGAKTGTAEDPGVPGGGEDHWMTAAAPLDNPAVVVTALVQGSGAGESGSASTVSTALQYFFAHQAAILSTAPAQRP
jgi:cell division protein FtsI/penicillin-binding protein 2/cell division protein FtsW (lipid II flippase)